MKTGISNKDLAQIREQMLKFATLQVGDSVLAEDLVQESFWNYLPKKFAKKIN